MGRVRISTVVVAVIAIGAVFVLLALRQPLLAAHQDETIHYIASDAGTYYSLYDELYAVVELVDNLPLFLTGSPILFMKLTGGDLLPIQIGNLLLMMLTLMIGCRCFHRLRSQIAFVVGTLLFPYFLLGFLSLNKEVYAMCSAIWYASWLVRGRLHHLVVALLLAACARYYMVAALLVAIVLVPRLREPRWGLALALLLLVSIVAPVAKYWVPSYSEEEVLEVSGVFGRIFSLAVDNFGYAIIYPIKYLALMPMRAYGFLIDSGRPGDGMEALVSIASLIVFGAALLVFLQRRHASAVARRLIALGLLAPLPIMWSEIMHWRYYSFVYFFLLFAVITHRLDRAAGEPARPTQHA